MHRPLALTALFLAACATGGPLAPADLPGFDTATQTLRPRDLGPDAAPDPGDRDAQPVARVNPTGFEACLDTAESDAAVKVVFDVDRQGQPANLRVAESNAPCFDAYTLRAVSQWRYAPAAADGQPRARRGVTTIVRYQVSDDRLTFGQQEAVRGRLLADYAVMPDGAMMTEYVLYTDPLTIEGASGGRAADAEGAQGVTRVLLVSEAPGQPDLAEYVGRDVFAIGILSRDPSDAHHTEVRMSVVGISVPEGR